MQNRKTLEAQIRSSLLEAAAQVDASDLLEVRIRNRLGSRQIKEENRNAMKKILTLKRVVVLAAVVCCLATATIFASGTLTYLTSTSSNKPMYTSIPSVQQLVKDIGYAPKIIDAFSNGYVFKNAKIESVKAEDDSGKALAEYKELTVIYGAADSQEVNLSANNTSLASNEQDKGQVTQYNGTDLRYFRQTYKFVPENYKLTADDQKAQADGSVVFSYSTDSDSISTEDYQFVLWTQNGIHYNLMTKNVQPSGQDLLKMAQELVDLK